MKILFIGARLFDDVAFYLKEKGIKSIVTESNPDSPNLELADDYYIVPRGMDKPVEIAINENVDGIISLIGIDDPLMDVAIAKNKIESENEIPLIASNINTIDITHDKIKTKEFFKEFGIETPNFSVVNDLEDLNLHFPLVLKQKSGQGGRDIVIATNTDEAIEYFSNFENVLCEEFIEGSEISIEVLGFNGEYLPIVPAYKGETTLEGIHPLNKVRSAPLNIEGLNNEDVKNIAYKIAKDLKIEGIIDIDFIFSKKDKKIYALEINARPSGTRYLTAASSGIHPLVKLIDMVSRKFDVNSIKKEIKDYFAIEIPIGNYNGPLYNESFDENPLKKFTKDSWVVHGPPNYQRLTISGKSKEIAKKIASDLLEDQFENFDLNNI